MWHHDVAQSSILFCHVVCACVARGDNFRVRHPLSGWVGPGLTLTLSPRPPPIACHLLLELTITTSEISEICYVWGQLWKHLLREWLFEKVERNVIMCWTCGMLREEKVIWVQLVHFFFFCKITKQQWWAVGDELSFFSFLTGFLTCASSCHNCMCVYVYVYVFMWFVHVNVVSCELHL